MIDANEFPLIAQRLERLLAHRVIAECPNRQGVRQKTGELLASRFVSLCASLDPNLSVEVGAHEADFSIQLKAASPRTRVVAFEANPDVYKKFKAGLQARSIDYRHVAICDRAGEIDLFIPTAAPFGQVPSTNAISSLKERTNHNFGYKVARVSAMRLDDAIGAFQNCTAVAWVDAEGGQDLIFSGAVDFLQTVQAIYIEVERKQVWKDQFDDLQVQAILERNRMVPIMRDSIAANQYNQIFVKQSAKCLETALRWTQEYVADIEQLLGELTGEAFG